MWPEGGAEAGDVGRAMYGLVRELYPIPRSITGEGLRTTLRRLGQLLPIELREVASGTKVLDWMVPPEWNVKEAWIGGPDGERVVDFSDSSLHLMGYSVPVRGRFTLEELRPHLHALPDHPDWIPYRTSYYQEAWGFCLTQRVLDGLEEGEYEVCIDSTLEPGHLSYGECVIGGEHPEEVLISSHACHPALANDNLSGVSLAVALGRDLLARPRRRYTYRLLFIPGTIGAITWLAGHEDVVGRIEHGLVLSGVGDPGDVSYKRSRRGDAEIDRAVAVALRDSGDPFEIQPFVPYGYDERQYCSPGFDLPVGRLGRTPYGRYPEYHTSADDLDFVAPEYLADSLEKLRAVVDVLERNDVYRNLSPKGEPQLGRRGLYRAGGGTELPGYELALLWVLNLSDGTSSLLDIAERSELPFPAVARAAEDLAAADLLEVNDPGAPGQAP